MDWTIVIVAVIVDVVLTGILLYALQTYLDERVSKRLSRFNWLHKKQAETIAELYSKLAQAQNNLYSVSHAIDRNESFGIIKNAVEGVRVSVDEFWDYFRENQIYFPGSLKQIVRDFYRKAMENYSNVSIVDMNLRLGAYSETGEGAFDKELAEISKELAHEIMPIVESIEQEFRKLLDS
jgi:hypothetical protein